MHNKDIWFSFSKLGFSDINMSATYAKKGLVILLTCDNLKFVTSWNLWEDLENLCKPDEDIQ